MATLPPRSTRSPHRRWLVHAALAGLLLSGSALLYGPSLGFGFTLDDRLVTVENSLVTDHSLPILSFLGRRLYDGTVMGPANRNVYRPIPMASFVVDHRRAGPDPSPYHGTNVALFGLCVLAVYAFGLRLAHGLGWPAVPFAGLLALVFLVFPSHMEAVANIKGRDEILACLFGLVSWVLVTDAQGRLRREMGPAALGGAVVLLLALLSKESAILFLPAILLWDVFVHLRSGGIVRDYKPAPTVAILFGALATYFALRLRVVGAVASPPGVYSFFTPAEGVISRLALSSRVFFEYYLFDQVVRLHLNPMFSNRIYLLGPERPPWGAVLSIAGLLLLAAGSLWTALRRRAPYAALMALFILTSALTLQIIPTGTAGAFRLMFTPSLFLCATLIVLLGKTVRLVRPRHAAWIPVTSILVGLLGIYYGWVTWSRLPSWTSDASIARYAASVAPENPEPLLVGDPDDPGNYRQSRERALAIYLAFDDRKDLFDLRNREAFAVVATELGMAVVESDPVRAIRLAELGSEQFRKMAALAGAVDTNATGPWFVKATALARMGRLKEAMEACQAGLAIAEHVGLRRLLGRLQATAADELSQVPGF